MDLLSELAAEWNREGAAGLLALLQQELLPALAAHCRRPTSAVPEMLAQVRGKLVWLRAVVCAQI